MKIFLVLNMMILLCLCSRADGQEQWAKMVKEESSIHYHLSHPLHEVDAVSRNVDSRIEIDPSARAIEAVNAEVDVTTFDSGNSNRDSHAMEVIDALDFPDVNFTSTSVHENGDSIFVSGKMTFHGITKEIVIKGMMKWTSGSIEINGSFSLSLTEFKIERPALLMIPVDDELKFSLHAVYHIS